MKRKELIERIINLENELNFLKKVVFKVPQPKIDFEVDEKIWKKLRKDIKRIRKKVFEEYYGKK